MPKPNERPSQRPGQRPPPSLPNVAASQANSSGTASVEHARAESDVAGRSAIPDSSSKPKSRFAAFTPLKRRSSVFAIGWFVIIVSGVWLGAAWKGNQPQQEEKQAPIEVSREPSRDELLAVLAQRRANLMRVKEDLERKLARLEQRQASKKGG